MRTHHALQPRTPEQASYSIGRRDGKQFLKLYRSYLHGTLAGTREPVYEGTVVESADDWRLTAGNGDGAAFCIHISIHFSTCAPIRYCAPSGPDSRPCTCVLHR